MSLHGIVNSLILYSSWFYAFGDAQNCDYDDIIPDNYNKLQAPVRDDKAADVYVFMHILDLDEIEEANMDFRIHFFLGDIWEDHRLDLKKYKGNKMNILSPDGMEKIWKPDIIFENSKSGSVFQISVVNNFVKVMPDGSLYRASRFSLRISCRMNLHNYPMDTQRCHMIISSLGNPDSVMELHWIQDSGSPYLNVSQNIKLVGDIAPMKFDVSEPRTSKLVNQWVSGNFTYLIANFTFARSISSHIVNTYIPSTLVVVMSWLSFWFDVSVVPGRVTLGVTSVLTLATQGVRVRSMLPPINYMTALDIWLFFCVIMVFASLVEYAIAYNVARNESQVKRKPTHLKKFSSHSVRSERSDLTHVSSSKVPISGSSFTQVKERIAQAVQVRILKFQEASNRMDLASRILFPLTFSLFTVTYWAYYFHQINFYENS